MDISLQYCTDHFVKDCGKGFKSICPLCSGNDMWVTSFNNRAYCFNCGTPFWLDGSGKEYVPRKVLDIQKIREVYSKVISIYRKSLDEKVSIYLHNRGLDDSIIEEFSIGYCPDSILSIYKLDGILDSGLLSKNGDVVLSQRVIFPYIANHGDITDMRGRSVGKEEPRYKSVFGAARSRGAIYPYNYDNALKRYYENSKEYIILTEGEIKTIILHSFGYSVMGLPGINSWRSGFSPIDIPVVVLFDNEKDVLSKLRLDKAIAKFSDFIPELYVAVIPLIEDSIGADDFLLHEKGGFNRLDSVINNAVPYERYKKIRRF